MSFLWGMINVLQLITFQSLMSINIPALPRAINKIILDFSQMDLLPSELIISQFLNNDEDNDQAINDYFDAGGFDSSYSIVNLGSSFIYLIVSVPMLIITFGIKALPECK